jgi:hypothetical protein
MIRIDEIYNNLFLASLQDPATTSIHWFDPFGSTKFQDLCNLPVIWSFPYFGPEKQLEQWDPNHRILFWDQEPLHRDFAQECFDRFFKTFYSKKFTLVTSERDSEDACWAQDTYGFQPGYYFFHGWAALDWYRGYDRTFLSQPFKDRYIEKTFLCPNNIIGGRRTHRLELFAELVERELVYTNFVSFPKTCPYENKTAYELCSEHNIKLDHVNLPLRIDYGKDYHASSHQIDMWDLANRSLLHVITETVYHGRKLHLTEKTFKPIVMQQPFVLVSCQGSLEYLRTYGFKTFGEFWNEDYDECDDNTRIARIGQLLTDLDNLTFKEKYQLQKHLAPIVEHNFNWFYGQDFESLLWIELRCMINQW